MKVKEESRNIGLKLNIQIDLSWLIVVVQNTQAINLIFKALYLTWCIEHILISKMY